MSGIFSVDAPRERGRGEIQCGGMKERNGLMARGRRGEEDEKMEEEDTEGGACVSLL